MIPESSHCGDWKNRVHDFFHPKTYSQLLFDLKHRKYSRKFVKLNHGLQKRKKKKTNSKPEIKSLPELKYAFLGLFKVKKILNLNPPRYVEPFDTKTVCFGDLNLHQ
jgi:hypothetical protein